MEDNKTENNILPRIKVLSHNEDTGITEFDVDEKFVELVKQRLNLDVEPTEEQVTAFLSDVLTKASSKQEGWDFQVSK